MKNSTAANLKIPTDFNGNGNDDDEDDDGVEGGDDEGDDSSLSIATSSVVISSSITIFSLSRSASDGDDSFLLSTVRGT